MSRRHLGFVFFEESAGVNLASGVARPHGGVASCGVPLGSALGTLPIALDAFSVD